MHDEHDDSLPGQDSFIDVICNMVGILIILVMIVGVQASRAPKEMPPKLVEAAKAAAGKPAASLAPVSNDELDEAVRQVMASEQEIKAAIVTAADLGAQTGMIEARRAQLAIVQAAIEQEISERRAKLDAESQRQFDVQREIVAKRIKLNELTQQQLSAIADSASTTEEIECVPTPIAKTVTGEEIHVRLKNKQLAVIPVDELLDEVRRRGDYLRNGLRNRDSATDVYGPVGGFRMRMSVEKFESAADPNSPIPQPRRAAVVLQCVFLPTSDEIGQPLEQALLPDSTLMLTMRMRRSSAPTITAWVYPDSYAELRALKKALWEAGVPLAVRPLAQDQPIIFSTAGSKSSAQ